MAIAQAQQSPAPGVPGPAAVAQPSDPLAAQPAQPTPPPLPPAVWSPADVQQLLAYIAAVGREGLDSADYDAGGLAAALNSGDPALYSAAATDRFNKLSTDLALGHVRRADRDGWLIPDKDLDSQKQDALLRGALAQRRIGEALDSLLPTHPQYQNLKDALAAAAQGEKDKINRLRLNMERWRWLPRELGSKYIIVNVPAYYVSLVENGETKWRQRAVAGAIRTPTPMLTATATGVILNPWWEVPKSIEPEVRGKKGYVPVKGKDGKVQRWRQPPGPTNALGQLKFVMPNSEAIFLHDTNARSRFNDRIRSLSHGCIRTQDVVGLAKKIFTDEANPEWTPEKVDEALAAKTTVEAKFAQPMPVYIVYFSSAAATDGRIVNYEDVYRRDAKVLAALDGKLPAAKPKAQVAAR
ncbi:MAG TPA: L,D-transpeptidase family protein [Sphingomicrobium sp.]|nr:L,D-transpeptidase family protein [Sphingomicrobium sp.]